MRKMHSGTENRESFSFSVQVAAASSGTMDQKMGADGTVERIRLRIYTGAQLGLHLVPYILRPNGVREDLVRMVGKAFIDGDDDHYDFYISKPVYRDEKICVDYWNDDAVNAYDFRMDVEVDHAGGPYRWPSVIPDGRV